MVKNGKKWLKNGKNQKMSIFEKTAKAECQNLYFCECGKSYKYQQGLSRHKKSCELYIESNTIITNDEDNDDLKKMFILLMEQNKEILAQNTEIARKTNYNKQYTI